MTNDSIKKELLGETSNSDETSSNEKSLSSINNNSIVDAALQYASRGFYVIPISPISKRPLIKFANLPALTAEEIKATWSRYPDANVAIRTVQFFVIDVDRHDGVDGMKSLEMLGHPEWFENTLTERTAHNGIHYYFAKPKNLEITQKISLLKGVDLKYHVNNYVVTSPSKLGDKRYEWLSGRVMKPAPQGLIKLILSKEGKHRTYQQGSNVNVNASGQPIRPRITNAARAWSMTLHGLGDTGRRNSNLAFMVGVMLWHGVSYQDIGTFAVMANNNTPDPLSIREVQTTVNSIIATNLRNQIQSNNQ